MNGEYRTRALEYERKGRSRWAPLFKGFCRSCRSSRIRSLAIRQVCRLEGGQIWSQTYRDLLNEYYLVSVGAYSYGPCLRPGHLPPGIVVGNYSSLAPGIHALRRNHTIDRLSQHPLFYNAAVGLAHPGLIPDNDDNPLHVGHDVWIGMNVLIAPGCKRIGNGSVIAAGSVVTSDIPDFSIVGGVPARHIRWRFPEPMRDIITQTNWWSRPVSELAEHFDLFTRQGSVALGTTLAANLHRATTADIQA